jgi:hypothetical protein
MIAKIRRLEEREEWIGQICHAANILYVSQETESSGAHMAQLNKIKLPSGSLGQDSQTHCSSWMQSQATLVWTTSGSRQVWFPSLCINPASVSAVLAVRKQLGQIESHEPFRFCL